MIAPAAEDAAPGTAEDTRDGSGSGDADAGTLPTPGATKMLMNASLLTCNWRSILNPSLPHGQCAAFIPDHIEYEQGTLAAFVTETS